jgi:hypothetical protein
MPVRFCQEVYRFSSRKFSNVEPGVITYILRQSCALKQGKASFSVRGVEMFAGLCSLRRKRVTSTPNIESNQFHGFATRVRKLELLLPSGRSAVHTKKVSSMCYKTVLLCPSFFVTHFHIYFFRFFNFHLVPIVLFIICVPLPTVPCFHLYFYCLLLSLLVFFNPYPANVENRVSSY